MSFILIHQEDVYICFWHYLFREMKAKVNTNFFSLPKIKVKDCKEGLWLHRTCAVSCVWAFLSFTSLQYLIDELKAGAAAKLFLQGKTVWQAQDPGVCDLQSLESVGLSSGQVRSTCDSTCKSSASRVLEHSTHRIILLILSKSDLSHPHCVSECPAQPWHGHLCMAEF